MKSRASKGFLAPPGPAATISPGRRDKWLSDAIAGFVSPSAANKKYYEVILQRLWPIGHGIPGPHVTEAELRAAIDGRRESEGKDQYKDVFRRVRELQGEEGFTSIVKEGVRYQLQSLTIGSKREPRAKPDKSLWKRIKGEFDFRCAHCGEQEPAITLSPDHRQPRAKGGTNDDANWQPLCQQCNIVKSSQCQGCQLNCFVCSWAYPETYKPIIISDDNKERIRRESEQRSMHQSDIANEVLRSYFNKGK